MNPLFPTLRLGKIRNNLKYSYITQIKDYTNQNMVNVAYNQKFLIYVLLKTYIWIIEYSLFLNKYYVIIISKTLSCLLLLMCYVTNSGLNQLIKYNYCPNIPPAMKHLLTIVSSSSIATMEFTGSHVSILSICTSAISEREHFYSNRYCDWSSSSYSQSTQVQRHWKY